MKTETRFTKIKYDGAKVRIEYEVEREGKEPDEYSLFSGDAPTTAFQAALGELRQDVIAICELPLEQIDKLHIRCVSVSHTNGIMGACITALKSVQTANAPLVLNTPHLPSAPYSDNPEPLLPAETCERIRALMAEAQKYIDGERAQGDLFADVATPEQAIAKARVHEAVARLGSIGDGIDSVTMTVPGHEPVVLNRETSKKHRAAAKALREHAATH